MQNLKIIEGNFNAHLNAIEYLLQQLGVDYKIDTAGYMTIEQEA